jgi:hypothetical protein
VISRTLRKASQPTHDSNRKALVVMAIFLMLVVGYLLVSHLMKHTAPPAGAGPAPAVGQPGFAATPGHTTPTTAAIPTSSRDPFVAP